MSSRTSSRQIAKEWVPPIFVKAARSARRRWGGGNGHGTETGPLNPDKIEYGADFYDASFETDGRWTKPYFKLGWYGSWSVIGDRVMRADAPRVLDMGCGAGHLAHLLFDRGLEHYTGFDFSTLRLEQARLVVPQFRFEVADAYATDLFETVDYNIVVCTEFLEHLDGDLEVLGRIRSGTRVLGTVPNYDAHGHVRYFHTREEVQERYAPTFARLDVTQIPNVGGDAEWLMDGVLH